MSSQETFSITTLQRMCAMSEYLDESDIHMNDKTVSWDGNIIYYKNKKQIRKKFLICFLRNRNSNMIFLNLKMGSKTPTKSCNNSKIN